MSPFCFDLPENSQVLNPDAHWVASGAEGTMEDFAVPTLRIVLYVAVNNVVNPFSRMVYLLGVVSHEETPLCQSTCRKH